jgi:MraZ protein
MFLGEHVYTLDSKGRLTLPAKYRDELASGIVITRGLDRCLFVFTLVDWERFTAILGEQLPFTNGEARKFSRFLFSGAVDAIPDKQGRVLIPQYLRDHAGLDGEVIIIGTNNRLEVWQPERWQQTLSEVSEDAETIAEHFSTITF